MSSSSAYPSPASDVRSDVSPTTAMLLKIAASVNSYWSRKAFGDSFNELQMQISAEERNALHLIHKGLFRLYPFDPDRDYAPRRNV